MGLFVATVAGLVIWIVGWGIGWKPFDSFMISVVIILTAATVRIALRYVPGNIRE
jgi:hypothetical protein